MKIKKIIAREGLIIIGIVVIGYIISFVSDYFMQHSTEYYNAVLKPIGVGFEKYEPLSFKLFWNRALVLFSLYGFPSMTNYPPPSPYANIWYILWLEHFGEFIFLYGYIIYLPFRFIIWALRTLKEK